MDLQLENRLFLVTGATSGFGRSIATALLQEGAHVLVNARGKKELVALTERNTGRCEIIPGDITLDQTHDAILEVIGDRKLDGALINAGGPPAKSFLETNIEDWDHAYHQVLRWKVKLTRDLLGVFEKSNYGRLLYIESISVKQPIDNLVLSNSLRLAVIGFVKTLSLEIARKGITANAIAPGYHATPAMERLFEKRAFLLGIDAEQARKEFEREIQMGYLGNPEYLASLAVWLLSPQAGYITGQTISVDGGLSRSLF